MSENVMKSFSGFGTSLLACLCILFLSTTAQAKTDCSEIEKSIKSDPFEIAESLLDDGLPKICAYFLAEHLNKKGYTKSQNKIQKLLTLAARYSDRIKEPDLTVKILVLKLDTEYDQSSFSKDRKSLRRLDKAQYEKLRKAKKKQLMRPIILAAINPLKAGEKCAVPEKKSPWLKFLIGDPKSILAQCSRAAHIRQVTAQFRKKKLPGAGQLNKANANLTAVGRFSKELKKKYASMSGAGKAHKSHLTAAANARALLTAGSSYIKLAGQAKKAKGPAKRRTLLRQAKKHAKVLGFDSKGVGKGISNLKFYADAKKALKRVPTKPIKRSKLAVWLADRNVKQDQVVRKSLKLTLHYQDCVIAEYLEKASGCKQFKAFPDKMMLSNSLDVRSMTKKVNAKIAKLIHSGWDGVRLDPEYRGNAEAFFTSLAGPYGGAARKQQINHSELIVAGKIAKGLFGKDTAMFIQGLSVEIQAKRGWIEYGKCTELNKKLNLGSVKGLSYKLINSRFSRSLDVFAENGKIISSKTKLQYLKRCSIVTMTLLEPWLVQHFTSLCLATISGYGEFSPKRIGRNATTIARQLKFGILAIADFGSQSAIVWRNYFKRKALFLKHLADNEFSVAEKYLDEIGKHSCAGGFEIDKRAFQTYKDKQSKLVFRAVAQPRKNTEAFDLVDNRHYGSYQQNIIDYVEPEAIGDTSFMWDQPNAESRSVAFSAIMSSTTGKFDIAEQHLNILHVQLPKSVPKISSYIVSARSDASLWNLYSGRPVSTDGAHDKIKYDEIGGAEEEGWQVAYKKGSYDNIVEAPSYWSRVPLDLHKQVRRESLISFFSHQYFNDEVKFGVDSAELNPMSQKILLAIKQTKRKSPLELASPDIAIASWRNANEVIEADTTISPQIRAWRLAELSFVQQWTILTRLMGTDCSADYLAKYLSRGRANWRIVVEPQRPVDQLPQMTPAMKFTLDDLYRQAYGYVKNGSCAGIPDDSDTQLAPAGNEGGGN